METVFKLEELPGPIALVTFDVPGQKVNTLGRAVQAELSQLVDQLEKRTDLRGLLLRSGKPGQFIAGADLNELGSLIDVSKEDAAEALHAGHRLFDRVSDLPFPTISLIDGPCVGGGTELSLALDERLAADNAKTRIGLPEVTIGLIPGWGGTQRLPRLIGLSAAMEMIFSGEPLPARKAASLGLVFDAVPSDKLIDEGCRLIETLRKDDAWKAARAKRRQPLGLSEDQARFAFACAEGQIKMKAKGQYTAALIAMRAMQEGINLTLADGLARERAVAMDVIGSRESANLIGVFFMNTALSQDRGISDPNVKAKPVSRVGVLGSGLMGAGIATAHARSGIPVTMVDVSDERLADGMARARHVIESRLQIGRATPDDLVQMLSRLGTSTSSKRFEECDVVVEAITENEGLKTQAYRQFGDILRDDAILASNTSTISITRMSAAYARPERFVGMHFFFPVDRMQLVEVIRGDKTSNETVVTIVELARKLRKTPIVCKDCPGFLVNRILFPYMHEALLLLLEGASMDQIDRVATKFGFPMGPIALHDLVGLDTAFYAGQVMVAAFSDRAVQPKLLGDLVQAGRLGKKSGAGFRKFVGKKSTPTADPDFAAFLDRHRIDTRSISDDEIRDRLLLAMLLEATRVLEEGIVREPLHVDMGLILGIGFPAYRGGLLRWCDTEGAAKLLDRLTKFTPLGKRFEPTELMKSMASSGKRFHMKK